MLDTIIVTSLFNSTICIIWRRALSICTTFFYIKFCSMAQSIDTTTVQKYTFFKRLEGGAV